MREIIALITAIAAPPIAPIAIIVFLILAVVILIGIIILFRRQRKKKSRNTAQPSPIPDWQSQVQQQGTPGSWNQAGSGNNTWGQQPGAWGTPPPAQPPSGWGAQASPQQQFNTWSPPPPAQESDGGTQAPLQQQSETRSPPPPAQPPPGPWGASPFAQQQQASPPDGSSSSNQQASTADPWASPSPAQQGNFFSQPGAFAPPTSNNPDLPMSEQAQAPESMASNTADSGNNNDDRTIMRVAPAGSQGRNLALEHLQFTAFHPRVVQLGTWSTLLVYAYIDSALQAIRADATRFKDELGAFPGVADAWASRPLTRGTQITIVPTCQGVTFNPERIPFTWLEDWHPSLFRFQADKRLGESIGNGEITIYGGPLIIASLKFSMRFVEQNLPPPVEGNRNKAEISAHLYKRIFASYNHADTPIVLACRNAYKALGLDPLIDIDNLRSGQVWSTELMKMIDVSDLFQLFWSERSAQSKFVRQEWQYALQNNKGDDFIRPVYWEKPLVSPPIDLEHLHFEYILLPRLETPDHIPPAILRLGLVRIEEGKGQGRIYELGKSLLSIGRNPESDIFLEDLAVSRLHATIENRGNENYTLKDEGSANGTKLNGQIVNKYQTYTLQEGDRIQLGQTVLIFSRR